MRSATATASTPSCAGWAPPATARAMRSTPPRPTASAAVSAFGFGGSNFHCVLEEHDAAKPAIDWDGEVQIAALRGHSIDELRKALGGWESLEWDALGRKAAESRHQFRAAAPLRLL